MDDNKIEVKCAKCGIIYQSSKSYFNECKRENKSMYCPGCAKIIRAERMKARMQNMSAENKKKMYQKAGKNHSNTLQKMKIENPKKFKARMDNVNKGRDEWLSNVSAEEKERISKIHAEANKKRVEQMTPEEYKIYTEKFKMLWANRSDEFKKQHSEQSKSVWANMSDEDRIQRIRKSIFRSGGQNNLHKHFERAFKESHLSNSFTFVSEYVLSNNGIMHSWDYGIFDKNNNLVAVVDLDGAYFHADICDYDGIHSKEEYDEKRSLSVPENIKIFIIRESMFSRCFEEMIKMLMLNYDEYVNSIFQACRSMPFPEPHYTDEELIKSYDSLLKMDCNDKHHQELSLNTRIGDRLIYHFHHSIYQAHVNGELSPYDAWYRDDLLMKVIQNRIIYQTYLNPNKILQGFNIAKIAPKVSVFSAARAKMIINKYLSEYDIIFDPFSGFSGRMLGTISLGKKYIGQDISSIHINESNNMIKYLMEYEFISDVILSQKDILTSYGKYPCLFTCPPYSDKEQWLDVPVDKRSCDDWITECLNRFECNRYVFVIDNTIKYREYITDIFNNKSHFNTNSEKLIIIDRMR